MPARSVVLAVALLLAAGGCGEGEDRPGQVTTEDLSGSVSGTGSGSGTVGSRPDR